MGHFSKKKYLKLARGFYGQAKNCPRSMIPKVHKALQYAYISRRLKKRNLRREWIQTINTGVREHQIMYSRFVHGLNNSNIKLDRKILAGLTVNEPYSFKAIVDEVKIQGKLQEINNPNKITLLEAYAKGLLIDTPLKKEQTDPQIRKQKELESQPFFYGERQDVKQKVQEGLQKRAQIAKTLEKIKK